MESHNDRSRSKKRSALFAFGIAVLLAVVLVAVTGTSSPAYCMGYRIFDDLQSAGLPLFEKDSQASASRSPEKDSSRSDLAETSPIQPDGLSEELVPARAVRDAEEFLQYPAGLPAGCEPVSLALALRCCGFDVTPEELIGGYLVIDETWTYSGAYMGSPYLSGGSFPPGMIATADAYLEAQASPLRAVDASGVEFEDILALAEEGSPVLVWTTMYGDDPEFSGHYIGEYAWYLNEHCVLMYGVEGDEALLSDPLQGLVREDAEELGRLYEACGSYAVYLAEAE